MPTLVSCHSESEGRPQLGRPQVGRPQVGSPHLGRLQPKKNLPKRNKWCLLTTLHAHHQHRIGLRGRRSCVCLDGRPRNLGKSFLMCSVQITCGQRKEGSNNCVEVIYGSPVSASCLLKFPSYCIGTRLSQFDKLCGESEFHLTFIACFSRVSRINQWFDVTA